LQMPQDAIPQAASGPVAKAIRDTLPGAEALGEVAPAAAVRQGPEDAINYQAVVFPLAAALAVLGQEVLNLCVLVVGKLVGRGGDRNEPFVGKVVWNPI